MQSLCVSRNAIANPDYRYSYQGQESETSQQLVEFDLRMYDANLGRWLSPDPFSEFHSPYLAMGNDPVNRIDPTGGSTAGVIKEAPAVEHFAGHGFELLDYLMGRADMQQQMNEMRKTASTEKPTDESPGNGPLSPMAQINLDVLNLRTTGFGYGVGNPLVGAAPAVSASGRPIKVDAMMRESMELYSRLHPVIIENSYESNKIENVDQTNKTMGTATIDWEYLNMNWVGGDSEKDIYLGIAGGVVSGMELSYLNDAKQVLRYGQRIDGKVRSAETLTRANRISSTATAKYLGYAGKALGIYGAYDAGTKLLNDPTNPAHWVKFGASSGMLFMRANPFTFAVGVGYTVLDQGGYIDEWIGNKP